MSERWKIRVAGYGTFDFEGTEAQAEEMRRHKAQWERGVAHKWRVGNQTEADKITAEMCALFDAGNGVSEQMLKRLKAARSTQKPTELVHK